MHLKLQEECGVFGIYSPKTIDVIPYVYNGLFALQHRGQESCGIAVNNDGIMKVHKDVGLIHEVFSPEIVNSLGVGGIAIGHVLYGKKRIDFKSFAQPLIVNHIKGSMALALNGKLINNSQLREKLELEGAIFHTTSDSEVISYIIVKERLTSSSIEEALVAAMDKIKGAYSLLVMSPTKLIAARDPNGFRPLCIGKLGDKYVFASESVSFDAIGATFLRDVLPGEIVIIDSNGLRSIREHCNKAERSLCVFEYVYFARPDSVIDGVSVHQARQRAGALLALDHPVDADVVIGVPDTGIDAALGYSKQSGIPYGVGLIKSKYIGRIFIQPEQAQRENSVRLKLNAIKSVVFNKRVVLIDDSIVRGTTSAHLVELLRDAGALEVHLRVSAPPFRYTCYFGTDIDSEDRLIASNNSIDDIKGIIGVDSLGYLTIESVKKLGNDESCGYCTGCFSGEYPLEVTDSHKKSIYERALSDKNKEG